MDRLTGLGNAIVPQIAQQIGEVIKKVEQGALMRKPDRGIEKTWPRPVGKLSEAAVGVD